MEPRTRSLYPLQKNPTVFTAILRRFGPGRRNFYMRFEFGLHMPVKFYLDPLGSPELFAKKTILSKLLGLRCQAFAWQRTIRPRYLTSLQAELKLFVQSGKLQLADLLQNCYFWLIQKTISNSL